MTMRRSPTALVLSLFVLAACGAGQSTRSEWTETVSPAPVTGETADPVPVDRVLPDGRYWATANEVLGDDDIVFTVVKARFGATCEAWATERGLTEGCTNDYAVDDVTSQVVSVDDLDWVTVADPSAPGRSYRIEYDTLVDLVRGAKVDVPAGRTWTPFPFVLEVAVGRVSAIDQYWVP